MIIIDNDFVKRYAKKIMDMLDIIAYKKNINGN